MKKKRTSFAFATGVVKVRENRLLPTGRWRTLAEMPPEELAGSLKETEYGRYFNSAGEFDDSLALREHWFFIETLPGAAELRELLTLRNDYLNAKIFLKARWKQYDLPLDFASHCLEPSCLKLDDLKSLIFEGEGKNVPLFLKRAVAEVLTEKNLGKDPALIDLILDRHYLIFLKEWAHVRPEPFFRQLVALKIDLYHLAAFFRIKAFNRHPDYLMKSWVPGGHLEKKRLEKLLGEDWENFLSFLKSGGTYAPLGEGVSFWIREKDPGFFEKLIQDLEAEFLKGARFFAVGPQALSAFALAKEREIKNIKILFFARKAGFETPKIMTLLGGI
jgi:vacuolar-type H+-ATPase subunit C/Vma6